MTTLNNLTPKTKYGLAGTAAAAVIASATAIIADWEGLSLTPYKDPIGIPTVCYGQTGAFAKSSHTKQECEEKLSEEVLILAEKVKNCGAENMPASVQAAFVSASYNIGDRIACTPEKSTAARYLKEGRWAEACKELPKWVYAGGKKLQGLVNRRAAETELCLSGVEEKTPASIQLELKAAILNFNKPYNECSIVCKEKAQ